MVRGFFSRAAGLIGMAGLVALPLLAAEQDGTESPVEGTVSDVSGATVKVLNGLVTIDAANAEIVSDRNDTPLTLAAIKVGTLIQASGTAGDDGKVTASRIQVHGPRPDGQISGKIDNVNAAAGRFSVIGLSISVTSSTLFEGRDGASTGVGDLSPGASVDVEVAVFQGKLVALKVSLGGGENEGQSATARR